ncbi:unnamed protein product [Fraxinus pennsylvanica]|uniref:NB-ARC domain-containing protein n=1 Tax=Fraxinus pennsylvanica TaxID=56036 RepID=A0AAD1ZBE3_9LAMI|nr:unnamed protein product [Fraxinus pennsylvanica]
MEIEDDSGVQDLQPRTSLPSRSGKSTMVGLDKELIEILTWMDGDSLALKTLSIVGMAGIGKTTFARKIYDHQRIQEICHVRAWVTVSQNYDERKIILDLLDSMKKLSGITTSHIYTTSLPEKIVSLRRTWIVNSSTSASSFLSTSFGFKSSELEIAGVGGIVPVVARIKGIRQLAKTRRFKAWFLDPSCFLHNGGRPLPDAMWALERLANYGIKMVIICDSPLPASTIMEELRIREFDTSLFVGAITSEDLRRDDTRLEEVEPSYNYPTWADDAGLEEVGPSYNYTTSYYRYMFNDQGSISPEVCQI